MIFFLVKYFLIFFSFNLLISQINTEIYLFDLTRFKMNYQISNPINISNSTGYDNQPFFMKKGDEILFVSTRNKQTDIVKYNIKGKRKKWLTETEGSEYSPIQIDSSNSISIIRLDKNGDQFMYKYGLDSKIAKILIHDLIVGYYAWINSSKVLSFVLGTPPTLQLSDLKDKTNMILGDNIGRTIKKIPSTSLMSFISKSESQWIIKSLNIKTGKHKEVVESLEDSEDFEWSSSAELFMGQGSKLYKFNPLVDINWILIEDLDIYGLKNITRLALDDDDKRIAIVVEHQ